MLNKLVKNFVEFPPIPNFRAAALKIKPKTDRVYDLTQAVPNIPTFQKIRTALVEDLKNPETSFYTHGLGLKELREKIIETHPLCSSLCLDNILITAGANQAMYMAISLLFDIGDKLALLEPYYFNYDMVAKAIGLKPIYFELSAEDDFLFRAKDIIKKIDDAKPSGIILITPNNPTGACYDPDEILELLKYTSRKKIEVLIDETYLRFDRNHLALNEIGKYVGKGLSIAGSFSKCFSLSGYRVGYLISGKTEIEQAMKLHDSMVICAPNIAQRAAFHGLCDCKCDVEEFVFDTNRKTEKAIKMFSKKSIVELVSAGAFFAYFKINLSNSSSEEKCLWLYENAGVLGLPGSVFGSRQQDYIRFAFCNLGLTDLDEVCQRLLSLR